MALMQRCKVVSCFLQSSLLSCGASAQSAIESRSCFSAHTTTGLPRLDGHCYLIFRPSLYYVFGGFLYKITMALKIDSVHAIFVDIKRYRRAHLLTAIASFGEMLFGWDTGMIGGVLTLPAFQTSFALNKHSRGFGNLQGNIVSVLQAGCFLGVMSSFFVSDKFGRRMAMLIADAIFILGSVLQVSSFRHGGDTLAC